MWTRIKEVASGVLDQQSVTFTETPSSLVGETVCENGLNDPVMMQLLEAMHDSLPNGCVFSVHNCKPRVIFIAAISRQAAAKVAEECGLRIAA